MDEETLSSGNTETIADLMSKVRDRDKLLEIVSADLSHKLRGSVATIIGLCHVIDSSNFSAENLDLFSWILTKAKELDSDIFQMQMTILGQSTPGPDCNQEPSEKRS